MPPCPATQTAWVCTHALASACSVHHMHTAKRTTCACACAQVDYKALVAAVEAMEAREIESMDLDKLLAQYSR